jgi:hypothetical protein
MRIGGTTPQSFFEPYCLAGLPLVVFPVEGAIGAQKPSTAPTAITSAEQVAL